MVGALSLWVATFCTLKKRRALPFDLHLGGARTDQGPQHTHHIPQLMVSWPIFSPHALFFHLFLKKCFLPSVGITFLNINPFDFASKISLFRPLDGKKNHISPPFIRANRSFVRSVRFLLAPWVHFSPPRAQLETQLHALQPSICALIVPFALFHLSRLL